jgi:DNA-binding NarL/FixJ family response regulator
MPGDNNSTLLAAGSLTEKIEVNTSSILVIEDEEMLRVNICEILKHYHYQVTDAASGEEGVQLASTTKPSLILCDIMLPGIDGHQVLYQIRKFPHLTCTPFIFLTAKSTLQDIRFGMEMGADDYITKPFGRSELYNSIKVRLERLNQVKDEQQHNSNAPMKDNVNFKKLTKAELRILKEIALGLTSLQISEKLYLSKKTIENHRTNISHKLELNGPNSLIQFAYRTNNKFD